MVVGDFDELNTKGFKSSSHLQHFFERCQLQCVFFRFPDAYIGQCILLFIHPDIITKIPP